MCGITIDSSLFSSLPTRSYLVDGLYVRVPSNYDPDERTYSGVWDGGFKVAVTSNPAWVLYDILTNERYGLGQFIKPEQIDKAKLYQVGRYCDEKVQDGFGGLEPRFTVNTEIQTRADAYQVITSVCGAFSGMAYWNGGMVGFSQDAPGDPGMVYNAANVVDGMFNYTGSSRKDRHSVVLVTWNDPSENYKQIVEYVEDQELSAKFGIRQLETMAFGCTSRGMANRVGRWSLYSERYESDVLSFKVGLDSAFVLPGEIVKIHDPNRAGKRMGGRLANCTLTSATLDAPAVISSQARISIRMPDGAFIERPIQQAANEEGYTEITWAEPLNDLPVPNAIWLISEDNLVPMLARVISVEQGDTPEVFTITAAEHYPTKYDAIEKGWALEIPKNSIIVTDAVDDPKNPLVIESQYQVAPGIEGLKLNASWEGKAAYFEITWKRTGKYPTNPAMAIARTPDFEIENAYTGLYTFVVYGISIFGKRSRVLRFQHQTEGKTAAPGDVINFQIKKRSSDLLLTWDAVEDISIIGYEIRVGPSWDYGEVLTTNFYGTMLTHDQDYAGTYYYHIRSINLAGEYSDNVSTAVIELTEPITPRGFDAIQSGVRLDLRWEQNPEPDLVYYEIRQGTSWDASFHVWKGKTTSLTLPAGSIDSPRLYWIKAVTMPGIYCAQAAWVSVATAKPSNTNIVASFDERMMGWPNNQINMHPVNSDLVMDDGETRAEYIFPIDLLDTYLAQNSIFAAFSSVSIDTDELIWDNAFFTWDSAEADRQWLPQGALDSIVGRLQISRKTGLKFNELEAWSLNNTLLSENGLPPTTAENISYVFGRYTNGLRIRGGVKADWTTLAVPSVFSYTMWIIPYQVNQASEIEICEFANTETGEILRLAYEGPSEEFWLIDRHGNVVSVPFPIEANDKIAIGVSQGNTSRRLFVGKVGSPPIFSEETLPPAGTFNAFRLYWS
jgi:hypothetical protein